jgi:hypothetical protein
LKLKCDEPLSNFAFNFNLRRYIKGWTPSATYLSEMFCSFMCVLIPLLTLHLQLIDGTFCSLDHTFRISKYIWVGQINDK